jgi:hypothetical protein
MGWFIVKCILSLFLFGVVLGLCLPVGLCVGMLGVVALSAAAGRK